MDKKTEQLYRDALAALPPLTADNAIDAATYGGAAGYGESDFTTAVKVGALGLGESVNRIGAALGSEGAQRRADDLATAQQFYSSRIAAPQQFSEVDSAAGLGGYVVQGLGKSLSEMALAAIPGGLAGVAARRAALAAGKTTAQAVAAGGTVGANVGAAATIPSGVGQALSSQFEQTGEYGLGAAVPLGLGYAALSRFGLEGGAASTAGRGALGPAMEAATKLGAVGQAALRTGAVEAGQELAQDELVTQLARKSVDAEYDMLSDKAMAERGEAIAGGFFLGGTVGGGAEVFKSRKIAPDAQNPTDLMGEEPRTPRAPVAPVAPEASVNTLPEVDNALEGELMPPLRPQGPRGLPMPPLLGLPNPAQGQGIEAPELGALPAPRPEVMPMGTDVPFDTLANRAAQAQGVNPAMQNWNGQRPLPAPVDFVSGPQGVQAANDVMPEMQNRALEQRLDPAMVAQQGQQPQGEPTAERQAQGSRAMVRQFLYQNRIKPGSKIGQMALASKSLEELQQTILQAADKAGNEKTFAPLNRAFQALTGVDIDTFIEQREAEQVVTPLEPQGVVDVAQPSVAPVSQPVDAEVAQAVTPVEPNQPSGDAPVASNAAQVGRVGDNAKVAGLNVREDVPAVPAATDANAPLNDSDTELRADRFYGTPAQRKQFTQAVGATSDSIQLPQARKNAKVKNAFVRGEGIEAVITALSGSKNKVVQRVAEIAKNTGVKSNIAIDKTAGEKVLSEEYFQARSISAAERVDLVTLLEPHVEALRREPKKVLSTELGLTEAPVSTTVRTKIEGFDKKVYLSDLVSVFAGKTGKRLKNEDAVAAYDRAVALVARDGGLNTMLSIAENNVETSAIAASYNPDTDTIAVDSDYAASEEHVVTHELVHAISTKILGRPNKEQAAIIGKLETLRAFLVAQNMGDYALTNVSELLSEGMSNPMFQYKLTQIPYENTSAWTKFTQFIAELIGLKPDNAFTELLSLSDRLLDSGSTADTAASAPAKAEPKAKAKAKAKAEPKAEPAAPQELDEIDFRRSEVLSADPDSDLGQARDLFNDRAEERGLVDRDKNPVRFETLDEALQDVWFAAKKTPKNFDKVVKAFLNAQVTAAANSKVQASRQKAIRKEEDATLRQVEADNRKLESAQDAEANTRLRRTLDEQADADRQAKQAAIGTLQELQKQRRERLEAIAKVYAEAAKKDEGVQYRRLAQENPDLTPATASAYLWLESLIERNPNGPFAPLMRQMLASSENILNNYQVMFGNPTDADGNPVAGVIYHADRTIVIGVASEQTVLHEIFHATMDGRSFFDAKLDAELRRYMDVVREAFGNAIEADTEVAFAFENQREFLNYYFTSPTFRQAVNKVMPNRGKTIFGKLAGLPARLWNALMDFLNLPAGKIIGTNAELETAMNRLKDKLMSRPAVGSQGVQYRRGANANEQVLTDMFTKVNEKLTSNEAKAFINKIKRAGLGALTNDQIEKIYGKVVPEIRKVLRLMSQQEQEKNRMLRSADPVFRKLQAYFNADKDKGNEVANVAYESTEYNVWPDRALNEASQPWLFKKVTDKESGMVDWELIDPEVQEVYDDLRERYKAMDKEGKDIYQAMFRHHEQLRDADAKALMGNIADSVMPEVEQVLAGSPILEEVKSLISTMRYSDYDGKEYREARDKLRAIRRELNPKIGHVVTMFADSIGNIKHRASLPGPYLPLMRRGDFVYVRRSGQLINMQKKLDEMNASLQKLALEDKAAVALEKLREEMAPLKAATKKAKDALVKLPNSERRRQAVIEAQLAEEAKQKEIKEAVDAVKTSPYETARAEYASLRKEIQRMESKEEHYSVVYSDSEAELMNLRDEEAKEYGEPGYVIPKAEAAENAGLGRAFLDAVTAGATKNMDAQSAAQVRAMAAEAYLRLAPEGSAAKRRLKRKNVAGYSTDLLQNFKEHTRAVAGNVAKIKFAPKVFDAMSELKSNKTNDAIDVYNQLLKRQQLSLNQRNTPLQDKLTQFGALFFLGISPAFVILNATQNAMITYPVLGARFGFQKAGKEMLKVAAQVKNIYGVRNLVGKGAMTYEFDFEAEGANLTEGQKEMLREMQDLGVLNFTQVIELSGDGDSNLDKASRFAFHFPHHMEVANRLISSLTAYNLAIEAGKSQAEAVTEAKEATIHTHGNYNPDNKPLYFRQIYKPLTLFKSFAQMMAFLTYNSIWESVKGASPEVRSEARKRILGIAAMHQIFAGAVGLPGAGLVGALAEAMADEDDPIEWKGALRDTIYEFAGEDIGEILYAGISRKLGGDLSGRVGNPDVFTLGINLRTDPTKEGGEALVAKGVEIVGPLVGVLKNLGDGGSELLQGNFLDAMATGAPKGIADVFKGFKLMTEGDVTDRGVNRGEFGMYESIIQMVGINPASKARAGEQRTTEFIVDTKVKSRRTELLKEYTKRRMLGQSVSDIDKEIQLFSKNNPDNKITPRAKLAAVKRAREDEAKEKAR